MNKITYDERLEIYKNTLNEIGLEGVLSSIHKSISYLSDSIYIATADNDKQPLIDPVAKLTIALEQLRIFFGINDEVCVAMDKSLIEMREKALSDSQNIILNDFMKGVENYDA